MTLFLFCYATEGTLYNKQEILDVTNVSDCAEFTHLLIAVSTNFSWTRMFRTLKRSLIDSPVRQLVPLKLIKYPFHVYNMDI